MSGWHNDKSLGKIALSRRPREDILRDKVADFDKQFPVGTPVWFWKSLPLGPKVATTIRRSAFVASEEICCFVAGVSGLVGCDFISLRESHATTPRHRAEEPVQPVAAGGYVVGTFPRGAGMTRAAFEAAAQRPITLAGGGPEESLFGVRLLPGESPQELKALLKKKLPAGRFSIQPDRIAVTPT